MNPGAPFSKRMLLVDNQTAVRELLKIFLMQRMPDCEIVGEAAGGLEALAAVEENSPGVVVADVVFPDLSPVDFVETCHAKFPNTRMVAFCRWGQMTMVRKLIAAGVNGVVAKDDSLENLSMAISAVLSGGYYLAPSVESGLYRECAGGMALTDREILVLRLIAEGCPTKEVGSKLDISVKTAEKYRERIMQKLHLHDAVSLTRYAIRNGLAAL